MGFAGVENTFHAYGLGVDNEHTPNYTKAARFLGMAL
jgi:hypothetical protein